MKSLIRELLYFTHYLSTICDCDTTISKNNSLENQTLDFVYKPHGKRIRTDAQVWGLRYWVQDFQLV